MCPGRTMEILQRAKGIEPSTLSLGSPGVLRKALISHKKRFTMVLQKVLKFLRDKEVIVKREAHPLGPRGDEVSNRIGLIKVDASS
jgi:hypothetical protein